MLEYFITPDPLTHTFEVELHFKPQAAFTTLRMANWTSGSYMIRDYAANIHSVTASSGLPEQLNKNSWRFATSANGEPLVVKWSVFAYSPRIHDAIIDRDFGFINPPDVFLFPDDYDGEIRLHINEVPDSPFEVYTSLDATAGGMTYTAKSQEEFLDTPLTFCSPGKAQIIRFDACGIEHTMVITNAPALNLDRISEDVRAICETAINQWGSAPFERYMFHLQVGAGIYNGLEHQNSTVLQKEVGDLPGIHETDMPKDYPDFLQLVAHEYFHAWMVKFLRPQCLLPYHLTGTEVHTETLWVFEGFTTYYEHLLVRRAGLVSDDDCVRAFDDTFSRMLLRDGFKVQALSSASFNAWINLYKQTADSFYHQISYYGKGAMLALILDVRIRVESGNLESLDTALRRWYEGAVAGTAPRGLAEFGLGELFEHLGFPDLGAMITNLSAVQRNSLWEGLWQSSLKQLGLVEEPHIATAAYDYCGITLKSSPAGGFPVVSSCTKDGSGFACGLYADDEIIAVDGMRTSPAQFDRQIQQRAGQTCSVHVFHRGVLREIELRIPETPEMRRTELKARLTPLGQAWLSNEALAIAAS